MGTEKPNKAFSPMHMPQKKHLFAAILLPIALFASIAPSVEALSVTEAVNSVQAPLDASLPNVANPR